MRHRPVSSEHAPRTRSTLEGASTSRGSAVTPIPCRRQGSALARCRHARCSGDVSREDVSSPGADRRTLMDGSGVLTGRHASPAYERRVVFSSAWPRSWLDPRRLPVLFATRVAAVRRSTCGVRASCVRPVGAGLTWTALSSPGRSARRPAIRSDPRRRTAPPSTRGRR
jgi:hypothetical protein